MRPNSSPATLTGVLNKTMGRLSGLSGSGIILTKAPLSEVDVPTLTNASSSNAMARAPEADTLPI